RSLIDDARDGVKERQVPMIFLKLMIERADQLLKNEKQLDGIEQKKKVIDNAVQEWLLAAQLFTIQLRFDDAEKAYLQAIETAPDNFEANFAYALFNHTEIFSISSSVSWSSVLSYNLVVR